jgi:hypothetical protein
MVTLIAHRGNLDGPIPEKENSPEYIDFAIERGYDVEIDLRLKDGEFYLGHDEPQYLVDADWIAERLDFLWVHIKDFAALREVTESSLLGSDYMNYFCHEGDKYTLTSRGFIWAHDWSNPLNNWCIVPLLDKKSVADYTQTEFFGVCSDYILDCEKKWNQVILPK